MVTRPECVRVKAQDRHGNIFELQLSKLSARAACHEIDHLNGIIFTTLTDHFLTEQELEQLSSERAQNSQKAEQKHNL
jgi:peptide deformylase